MTNNLKFNIFAIHPDFRHYILSNSDIDSLLPVWVICTDKKVKL